MFFKESRRKRNEKKAERKVFESLKKASSQVKLNTGLVSNIFGMTPRAKSDLEDVIVETVEEAAIMAPMVLAMNLTPEFISGVAANFVYDAIKNTRRIIDEKYQSESCHPDATLSFVIEDDSMPRHLGAAVKSLQLRLRNVIIMTAGLIEASEIEQTIKLGPVDKVDSQIS